MNRPTCIIQHNDRPGVLIPNSFRVYFSDKSAKRFHKILKIERLIDPDTVDHLTRLGRRTNFKLELHYE